MSFCLFKGGRAKAVLRLSEPSTPQTRYAAEELRHYLGLMTGSPFEIVGGEDDRPAVAIGGGEDPSLGADGFLLRVGDQGASVVGGKRGVIYGVYELLEKLGCRFFTPQCEKIPVLSEICLPDMEDRQMPVLEYREHNLADLGKYTRFAVKCRLNGAHHRIREKHGGHMSYAWYVHTFETMVNPKEYAQSHPEYFALVDGKRKTEPSMNQLCLTNPALVPLCAQRVRERLREVPEAKIISLSQNDWGEHCECEACQRVDLEEGSPAGTLLRFVNAIAEALEPEFPDVIFDTLAYLYTRPAPKITRPRHNVCVRLCSIECCFSHPFESCDDERRSVLKPDGSRSSFMTDLADWGKVSGRNYIWDYTTCFSHYPTPFPNWNVLQPNMRAFVRNNVKGVFEQANGASHGGVDLNELRAYVLSKLLWDAETDVQKHVAEFTDYYYGDAGKYIRKYIRALTDKVEKENIHVGLFGDTTLAYLTEEMLDRYEGIFAKAKEAVKGDALRLHRVEKARLAIRYVRMKNRAMEEHRIDPTQTRDFFTDWQAFGLTRIEEWVSAETTHRALLAGKWRGTEFYRHWSEEGPEEL